MGDYRTDFVHFISVESRLARLQIRTIDLIDRLDFSLASQLDSIVKRSTRSVDSIDFGVYPCAVRLAPPPVCPSPSNQDEDTMCLPSAFNSCEETV